MDNSLANPASDALSVEGIKVHFLPPNATSILQPMVQGIIESTKKGYASLLLSTILYGKDMGLNVIEAMKAVTMKNAIYWLNDA